MLATMHPEDVKAGLRKRYGTVADFERAKGLPPKSVTEVLRGRAWQRVSDAIECALQEEEPPTHYPNFRIVAKSRKTRTV
jgi:lambda repressor-like predicted transcriptional regulator